MDFDDEHRIFRQAVRGYVEERLAPHADEWESERGFPKEVFRELADLDCLGITFPKEYGGADSDIRMSTVFAEELARCGSFGLARSVLVHTDMSSPYLANHGTREQKERFLREIIRGEKICAVAITEPEAGSDVGAIRTRAARNGSHYIIQGSKTYITNCDTADLFFVAAKTDPGMGHKGISLLMVERGAGLTTAKMEKMGLYASPIGDVSFDGCIVPEENLLGEENKGFYYLLKGLSLERYIASVAMVSAAQQILEKTIHYAGERELSGKKLSQLGTVAEKFAKLKIGIDQARAYAYSTGTKMLRRDEATDDASGCKYAASEALLATALECYKIVGGYGYFEESGYPRWIRDALAWKQAAGSDGAILANYGRRLVKASE